METHTAVFTWVLERVAEAGLVRGKTAWMRRRWKRMQRCGASSGGILGNRTRRSCNVLAEASGIATLTRAELARFDRSRKGKKTSNKEWQSPQDPDAKVAKMKDGRTHLAHKVEHGVDLETGAILSVTVTGCVGGRFGDASGDGDEGGRTGRGGAGGRCGGRRGGRRQGLPQRQDAGGARRDWGPQLRIGAGAGSSLLAGPEDGRDATGEACGAEGVVREPSAYPWRARSSSSTATRGAGGAAFRAPVRDRGVSGRVWVRGHENVRKRVLIQAASCNRGLLLRSLIGVGTPRSLQGRALSAICRRIGRLIDRWGPLTGAWRSEWIPAAFIGPSGHRQAGLNRPARRTHFFHGLIELVGNFKSGRREWQHDFSTAAEGNRHENWRMALCCE